MPATLNDPALLDHLYEVAAGNYLRSLPPEHFMEAFDHATQREITVESFACLKTKRKDVQYFNELLVQYPRGENAGRPGHVVPDNFVVISSKPIVVDTCYKLPLQPVGPFLVLEYISKSNSRKDYLDNLVHYEQYLKVPYYLRFHPERLELTIDKHNGTQYVPMKPNFRGRLEIPELELEAALLDDWVRFWHRGELLLLPDQLMGRLSALQDQFDAQQEHVKFLEAELARLRAKFNEPPQ